MVATLATPPRPDGFAAFAGAVLARFGAEAVLLTTMPRGGLQVCRSTVRPDHAARRYTAHVAAADRQSWAALTDGHAAGPDPAVDPAFGPDLATALCVRVEDPVFGGYPGVVRLLRDTNAVAPTRPASGDHAAADVADLFRAQAGPAEAVADRQFVFVNGVLRLGDLSDRPSAFADAVRAFATDLTDRADAPAGREAVPGDDGAYLPVQVSRLASLPALGDGPAVFVSLPPRVADWKRLAPDAFAADPELHRLTAAVAFMAEHFRRSPTLGEVADSVHLSQFHFHRRFTELFGLTPKHLLYDLQLDHACHLLADPRQPLASIARHCGFAHQSHFTSRFKQGTGLTPTRWRRQAAAANA